MDPIHWLGYLEDVMFIHITSFFFVREKGGGVFGCFQEYLEDVMFIHMVKLHAFPISLAYSEERYSIFPSPCIYRAKMFTW
jgi:hypothetical protein